MGTSIGTSIFFAALLISLTTLLVAYKGEIKNMLREYHSSRHALEHAQHVLDFSLVCYQVSLRCQTSLLALHVICRWLLSSVGQDDLEPYEYACEVPHKLFKFKSLSSAQNYLFLAMPGDRSLMFVFLVFHWLV